MCADILNRYADRLIYCFNNTSLNYVSLEIIIIMIIFVNLDNFVSTVLLLQVSKVLNLILLLVQCEKLFRSTSK